MGVVLREVIRGQQATILALGTENVCPLLEFLTELGRTNLDEQARVVALLDNTASFGPPKNEKKCRFFRDLRMFELKTREGVRVMSFWDEGRIIICSHAFIKKSQKTPHRELERARKARDDYFNAKKMKQVKYMREEQGHE